MWTDLTAFCCLMPVLAHRVDCATIGLFQNYSFTNFNVWDGRRMEEEREAYLFSRRPLRSDVCDLEGEEMNWLRNFRDFALLYDRQLQEGAAAHGLRKVEMDILLFLRGNPGYDRACDIVQQRRIAKAYVSTSVRHLCDLGYLEQYRRQENRREAHLRLLPPSEPAVAEGLRRQEAVREAMLRDFDERERQELALLLERLGDNARAALRQQEESHRSAGLRKERQER